MQKETIYRNHYKTNQRTKNTLIFFLTSGFYKTFESDAIIVSQLFWFKITLQEWLQTVWFLEKSTSYFDQLKDAGYSFVALKINEDWNVSILRNNEGNKVLDLSIPFENFQWLLDDILHLYEKYSTCLRLIQPLDLPFTNQEEYNKYQTNLLKNFELKEMNKNKSE